MECPVCGKQTEMSIMTVQVDGDDLVDYIFEKLVEKGFAPTPKEINTILDIVDEYMMRGLSNDET